MSIRILLAAFFSFQAITYAQEPETQVFHRVAETEILPVVVSQVNCPLKIEEFFVLTDANDRYQTEYRIRNVDGKKIRAYRIARWYSNNTGFMGYGTMPRAARSLLPGNAVDTFENKTIRSPATVRKDGAENPMKRIAFIIVVDVEFDDGTIFDSTKTFEAFTDHLTLLEGTYDGMPVGKELRRE